MQSSQADQAQQAITLPPELKLTEKHLAFLGKPHGFAAGVLGASIYTWAAKILSYLDKRGARIAVKAANGVGKTTRLAAPAALWNAAVHPQSLCVVTAGVFRQVKEQFFPAVRSYSHRLPGWTFRECEVIAHNGSRILGFSTDDAGRFEGWHNENLLIILDEAKSIRPEIFHAVERCQPTRLLMLSSPGPCHGFFYDAFHAKRGYFITATVTAYDAPHIEQRWIAEQIEKYGENHPLIRSMIFGEFMALDTDSTIISVTSLERCLDSPPQPVPGSVTAFCDFAAGGDENVLAIRRGNQVIIADAWRDADTMRAVGRFIRAFREHNLDPRQIYGDASGLGHVMLDRLAEVGWPLNRCHFNARSRRPDTYSELIAEIWYEGRAAIERKQYILPNDPALFVQLTTRRGWADSAGRLTLEPKEELLRRNLTSPDRAEAVLCAMYFGQVGSRTVASLLD